MKKKVLAMLLATTMVATAFAGCGSKEETSGEATTTETGAEGEEAITATIRAKTTATG